MRSEQELKDAMHELDIQRAGIFVEQAMLAGDRDNATFLLTSLRRVHSQNPVAKFEPGTDEYGNFIRGYEQGAIDGYR